MEWNILRGYKDKQGFCMSIKMQLKTSGGFSLKQALESKLKLNKKKTLQVGFFETAKYGNGTQVASVAYWQEFGTLKIPMRPFFRNAITKNSKKWFAILGNEIKTSGNAEFALNRLGEIAKGDIVQSITALKTPPNAESTIKQKGSSNPLINTGFLRASVNYKVTK